MRLQLAFQRLQTGIGKLCFKLGCSHLSFPKATIITHGMRNQNNRHIGSCDVIDKVPEK